MLRKLTKMSICLCLSISMLASITFASSNDDIVAESSIEPSIVTAEREDAAYTSGALVDDSTLTPDIEKELKKQTDEKDMKARKWYINKKKKQNDETATVASGFCFVPVTNFKQETSYWCGPASIKQALSFHKVNSGSSSELPSQSTIATEAGTTSSGSSTTGLADAINSYTGTFSFSPYISSDITDVSDPLETFKSRINFQIANEYSAPIVLIDSRYLPRYGGVYIRHYNTTCGYDDLSSVTIRCADPHYSDTYYGMYWDPIGSTTTNGIFRAVYYADVNGSNKVMLW